VPALCVLLVTAAGCFIGPATGRYIIPIMPLALLLTSVAVLRARATGSEALEVVHEPQSAVADSAVGAD